MKQEQQEHFSERVLRDMSSAVLVVDRKGNIIYVNQPASQMLEAEAGARENRYDYFMENDYNDAFFEAILNAFYRKGETTVEKVRFMTRSGRKYVFRLSSSFLP